MREFLRLRRFRSGRIFVTILATFLLSSIINLQYNTNLVRQVETPKQVEKPKQVIHVTTETENYTTTQIPFHMFRYPLDINFTELITNVSETGITNFEPINVYPFTYFKPMKNICKSTKEISLLFMIKSAPGIFYQRQAIRETWTNKTYFKQDIRHAFLIARARNKTMIDRLSVEKGIFNDIVQMTYFDDYYNNTYKTIGGINWCVKYCRTAQFVMMVDDDMYVATDFLLDYLHGLPNSTVRSLFAGYLAYNDPQRNRKQKWYMSVEDYPFNRYPPFVSAGAIIMSMDFVRRLQIAILLIKKFKYDDVCIGLDKLGVKPIHLFRNQRNKTYDP